MNIIDQIIKRPLPTPHPNLLAKNVSQFVLSEWSTQASYYGEWWNWYDNFYLSVPVSENSKIMKYPLRINPMRWVSNMHGRRLYGEYPDDAATLVKMEFRNPQGEEDDVCDAAAEIVNRVWAESNGAELMLENGIISQILGGCIYRVAWQPWNKRLSTGIRVTKVMPDFFLPIWDTDDPWYTNEVYLMQYITGDEAQLRYKIDTHNQPYVMYSEHWTNDTYEIKVDNKVPPLEGMSGDNPFKIVPFVYIPHLTRAGGMYGQSHIPGIIGLVEEFNSRMADRGDGVREAMINRPVLRNSSNGMRVRNLNESTQYIDLGSSSPGTTHQPDLYYLESNSVHGADISKQFTDDLWEMICHDTDTPPILWGFEDVALRSAMSMETLSGPYASHARAERIMHRTGLGIINKYILQMALVKGVCGVTPDMLDCEPRVRWARLMPRDRMETVQEMVQRRTVQPPIVSMKNAISQLALGEDVEQELEQIEEEMQEAQDALVEAQEMQQEAQQQQQDTQAEQDTQTMERQHEMKLEQQQMSMDTQRQNMMMKMKADATTKRNAKRANPRQRRKV